MHIVKLTPNYPQASGQTKAVKPAKQPPTPTIFAPMQYREIVAVTGLSGLYHLLSTKSDGAIVRALGDDATKFIPSRLHSVTPLESIEIYTTGANVRLHEVLQKMKDSGVARPDAKASPADMRGYFTAIFPEIDTERVYTSDMKKMLKWFDILQGANLLDFSAMTAQQDDTSSADGAPEDADSMPAEGAAQLTEHDKGGDTEVPLLEEAGEKPAKKARAKKSAGEEGEEAAPKKTAAKKAAKPKKEAE